uniref:ribosomal protein L12 n=1 Tax=Sargassum polycystum TaxID=127578 RepID=UPI0020C8FB93|nr:ribosomal protein L12 [Sargassum polycystum]YP_010418211.1 ribosomal protein L12 [Sargassum plagiophyllum]USF18334.1 ribosomal protein L12 [Sargassum polycystum]USF18429.1 ribosomal protein L12 [Sargassum plagiophyllum]
MTEKISTLIEELKTLTLLEATELVQSIEETFNVDASTGGGGGVMMMSPGPTSSEDENKVIEEKTEFDISLDEVPKDKKIAILKVVRSVTELGLKEAKEVVENTPKVIKEGLAKPAAEEAKKSLEEAGAIVTLK